MFAEVDQILDVPSPRLAKKGDGTEAMTHKEEDGLGLIRKTLYEQTCFTATKYKSEAHKDLVRQIACAFQKHEQEQPAVDSRHATPETILH